MSEPSNLSRIQPGDHYKIAIDEKSGKYALYDLPQGGYPLPLRWALREQAEAFLARVQAINAGKSEKHLAGLRLVSDDLRGRKRR